MGIRRKKSLLEQAGETVSSVADTVGHAVGEAAGSLSSTVGDMAGFVEEKMGDAVDAARDAVTHEEPTASKRGGKLKKVLILGVLVGIGGLVFSKLKSKNSQADNWQSSYVPKPPPAQQKTAGAAETVKESVADATHKAADKVEDAAKAANDAVEDPDHK